MAVTGNELRRAGILFCVVGPTGSGKTTFCERLRHENPETVRRSISVTTRQPRDGEQNGVNYVFTSRAEFDARLTKGEFFESEEVHGNMYGTLRATLDAGLKGGYDLLFDIDIRGAINIKHGYPLHTVITFLVPPSFEELYKRLDQRGTRDPLELEKRFATARKEYEKLLEIASDPDVMDYFIVNDSAERAYSTLGAILSAERGRLHRLRIEDVRRVCSLPKGVGIKSKTAK